MNKKLNTRMLKAYAKAAIIVAIAAIIMGIVGAMSIVIAYSSIFWAVRYILVLLCGAAATRIGIFIYEIFCLFHK